jgi:energy-coupling factor transport system permease protein
MFSAHPLFQAVSIICVAAYAARLRVSRSVLFVLPVMLAATVLAPLFNHEGATIIAYLPSGNPVTLESLCAGVSGAVTLGAALLGFACVNRVIDEEKLQYLFGRMLPALALLFSMILRFVPRFTARLREMREVRRGRNSGTIARIREGAVILSALVTWSLESAVVTADSMRSRGYGLPGRTSYSNYRFTRRDGTAAAFLLAAGAFIIYAAAAGWMDWRFYPKMHGEFGAGGIAAAAVYLAAAVLPLILSWREARVWRRLRSEI